MRCEVARCGAGERSAIAAIVRGARGLAPRYCAHVGLAVGRRVRTPHARNPAKCAFAKNDVPREVRQLVLLGYGRPGMKLSTCIAFAILLVAFSPLSRLHVYQAIQMCLSITGQQGMTPEANALSAYLLDTVKPQLLNPSTGALFHQMATPTSQITREEIAMLEASRQLRLYELTEFGFDNRTLRQMHGEAVNVISLYASTMNCAY